MKKLYTLIIAISIFACSKAQHYVTIPDTAFVSYLKVTFPTCMNGNQMDTTCTKIINAKGVYCSEGHISSLEGLQYFTHLDTLNCSNNRLTTISSLPATLKWFDGEFNQLTSLPTLPAGLTYLDCYQNQITSLPQFPPNLYFLNCSYNQITSLPVLPASLWTMYCQRNKLTSVPPFPAAANVIALDYNLITSIPTLPNGLNELGCGYNNLTSLPVLPAKLTILECDNNQISALPTLTDTLLQLECSNNLLTTLPTLPATLKQLRFEGNAIQPFPTLPPGLFLLYCGSNGYTSLPPLPAGIGVLSCAGDSLTSLAPLPFNLNSLDCDNTPLTSLPDLPATLSTLICRNCRSLTCLPPLPATMAYLYFDSTAITCLPNIPHITSLAVPDLSTISLCGASNTNGCTINWNISGSVYHDYNNNCIRDASESLLAPCKVKLYQGANLVQQTYSNGNYSFKTGFGTYTVEVDTTDFPFVASCLSGLDTAVNVTAQDSLLLNINFGTKCKTGFDVGAWDVHLSTPFFPGRLSVANVSAGDMVQQFFATTCNTFGKSGAVKVIIDGPAVYLSAAYGARVPVLSGDTLIYTINDFSAVNPLTDFAFNLSTSNNATIGNQVCITVVVTPTTGDNNTVNNILTHCFAVTNSYDPNEKEVSPIGNLPEGYNDWLTYTIHFQNTGTAAAEHIKVIDTLDANVDPTTFQLLAYSVMPKVTIKENIVVFDLPEINLPDSTDNSEGSKGYVEYRVKPVSGLQVGNAISNSASIYFDFNAPVVTNTIVSSIEVATSVKQVTQSFISIYPNPTNSSWQLAVASNLIGAKVDLYNVQGQIIFQSAIRNQQSEIPANSLSAGVYFIHISNGNEVQTVKVVKE